MVFDKYNFFKFFTKFVHSYRITFIINIWVGLFEPIKLLIKLTFKNKL